MSEYTAEEQAQHRKELVEALRSGKYKQGQDALRLDDTYCCLGVACDLSGLGTWESSGLLPGARKTMYRYLTYNTVLPGEVMNYYGFLYPEGTLTQTGLTKADGLSNETLIGMNDSGQSFETIAEFIEKGWVQLA